MGVKETKEEIQELESGNGVKFDSIEALMEDLEKPDPIYKEIDGKIIFNFTGAARAEGESFSAYKQRQKMEKELEKIRRHPNNNVFHDSLKYGTYVKEKK